MFTDQLKKSYFKQPINQFNRLIGMKFEISPTFHDFTFYIQTLKTIFKIIYFELIKFFTLYRLLFKNLLKNTD